MKFGVIGSGTAAAVVIMTILHDTKYRGMPYKVECIHNPNIPTLSIGEAVAPIIHTHMKYLLGFDVSNNTINATTRWGVKSFWENNAGNEFTIRYNDEALHIDSSLFSRYVFDQLHQHSTTTDKFVEICDDVVEIRQCDTSVTVIGTNDVYEFDYLIDCRGYPSLDDINGDQYAKPSFETLNTVLTYQHSVSVEEPYTTALFHKNGWMFGIPLQTRKAYGYLYNRHLTTKEEATSHFKQLVPFIETDSLMQHSWTHYYKKTLMDGRVISLGNRLYFFEPIQSLPLFVCAQFTYRLLSTMRQTSDAVIISNEMNDYYATSISKMEDIIAMNYAGNNKMDSVFWKVTKEKAIQRLKTSDTFKEYVKEYKETGEYPKYWTHPPELMKEYLSRYEVDLNALSEP